MKKLLALLLLLLMMQPAMAWAKDLGRLTGLITNLVQYNLTEDSTLTLENATLQGGMVIVGDTNKLKITLIGQNSIEGAATINYLPGSFALLATFNFGGGLEIVSDSDNASLDVNQQKTADCGIYSLPGTLKIDVDHVNVAGKSRAIWGSKIELPGDYLTVTSDESHAIDAYKLTISGNHMTIGGGYTGIFTDYLTLSGNDMKIIGDEGPGIMAEDGNIVISGDDILIESEAADYAIECENYEPGGEGEPGITFSGNNIQVIAKKGTSAIDYSEIDNSTWVMPKDGESLPVFTKLNESDSWEMIGDGPFISNVQLEKHPDFKGKIEYRRYLRIGMEYRVSFDSNGGIGAMADVICGYRKVFMLRECDFEAPAGKVFDHWELNGKPYKVGDAFEITSDIRFKAVWKDVAGKDEEHAVAAAEDLPQTGDPSSLMAWVTLLGASGLGMKAVRRRKK